MPRSRTLFLVLLAILAASTRLVPHPPNFAPMAALALFSGAAFRSRWVAVLVPMGSLLLSDWLLDLTFRLGWQQSWGFYQGQWVVYACTLATTGIGFWLQDRRSLANMVLATLAGSVLFFGVTNFAVWAYGSGATYPKTLAGLELCYAAGLPFFRNALLGNIFYGVVLFGTLSWAESRMLAHWSDNRASLPT